MEKCSLQIRFAKIVASALCGFIVAAFFVIYPGVLVLPPKCDLRAQIAPQLAEDLRQTHWGGESHGLNYGNTHHLRGQMLWLTFAQQEIDYLPILLFCSCVGPILQICYDQKVVRISKESKNRKRIILMILIVVVLIYLLGFLVFVSANLGECM